MKRIWMLIVVCCMFTGLAGSAVAQSYGLNDQAQEVARIQEALEELDFYYADITGKYGKRTQAAVRKFQKKYELPQTGVADEDTLALLYEKAGFDAPKSSSTDQETAAYGSETLREGSEGDAVRILQENLTLLDYYSGTITGRYGRLTKEAVRKFQKKNDLSADGVAGPRTFERMTALLVGEDAQETPVLALPEPSVSAGAGTVLRTALEDVSLLNTEWTLRRTSRSGYVKRLQKALAALGYDPGGTDGRFGEKTENAVRLYQTVRGLTPDGVAGRATLKQINEDIKNGVTAENVAID